MDNINTVNLNQLLAPLNQTQGNNLPVLNGFGQVPNNFMTDGGAFSLMANLTVDFSRFDFTMDNFASFKDMLTTANDGFEQMKNHGVTIRDLIEQAKEEGYTPESIAAIQDEVNYRLKEIGKIRENTNFNGVNPFKTPFALTIPDWQNFFGVDNLEQMNKDENEEETESEIKDLVASIEFDMNMGGADFGFDMGASATINIGYTEDGSLQIEVDATMDFDLSELSEKGAGSDNALDLINRFLDFITGKQNGLNTASNMLDTFMAKGTASIMGDGFSIDATNDINIDRDSKTLKGQIVQHAKITLDSTANQSPSIAINLL